MFRRLLLVFVFLLSLHVHGGEPTANPVTPALSDRYGDPLPEGALARFGTVRLRNSGHVCCVTYSPDGKLIASGDADCGISCWDAATGKQVQQLRGHTHWVESVAFAHDGKTLASVSRDKTVRIWDIESQEELQRFTGNWAFYSVTFSPDGKVVAAADQQGKAHLWMVASGKEVGEFQGYCCLGQPLAFSPDGKYLISPGGLGALMWEVATGKEVCQFQGHQDLIRALALSRDGKVLATGSQDATIRLWDVATGEQLHTLTGHEKTVTAVAFSADGKLLASRGYDNRVYVWETDTGKQIRQLIGCRKSGHSLAFSPDGKTVAVGGHDHAIHLWEAATGQQRLAFAGHDDIILSLAFSPDGKVLASGGSDCSVRLWDVCTSREMRRCDDDHSVSAVAFSTNGAMVAIAASGICDWDMAAPDRKPHWKYGYDIWWAGFSSDGKTAAWRTSSHGVYAHITGLDQEPRELSPESRGFLLVPFVMALSPDGKMLAAGTKFGLPIYDVITGKELLRLGGAETEITELAFSPDGKTLVSTNDDGTLRTWDPETGEELRRSDRLTSVPISLAFAPDGKTLALGNRDGSITLWDVAEWKERRRFQGHRAVVRSVAFSPDGKLLASGSDDTTILLWDVTDRLREQKPVVTPLTPRAVDALWDGLGSDDALEVHASLAPLVEAARQKPSIILDRVVPLFAADEKRIKRLIAELDDDRFEQRERAGRELRKLEDLAEPALHRTLDEKPSPEVRRRVQELLDKLDAPPSTPRQLRFQRAVEILERGGSDEARRALAVLAKQAPGRWLRDEAKAALLRMENEAAKR